MKNVESLDFLGGGVELHRSFKKSERTVIS